MMATNASSQLPVKTVVQVPVQDAESQQMQFVQQAQQGRLVEDEYLLTPDNCNLILGDATQAAFVAGPALTPAPQQIQMPMSHKRGGRHGPPLSSNIDKTKLKTKICKNWSNGNYTCGYSRCAFAHGDHEKLNTSQAVMNAQICLTPVEMPLGQGAVTSLTQGNLQFISTTNSPPAISRIVQTHVLQQQQQHQQQNSPLSTPVATPLTPADSGFSPQMSHGTPYDGRMYGEGTPMTASLTPMEFNDHRTVEFQLDDTMDLRTPLDNMSLCGAPTFGNCSQASSMYRFDPYPEVVDHVQPVAVPEQPSCRRQGSLFEGIREVSEVDASPIESSLQVCSPPLSQAVAGISVQVAEPRLDSACSTSPESSPTNLRVTLDNSPSEQMMTSEDASTGEEEECESSRAPSPDKALTGKAPVVGESAVERGEEVVTTASP